MHTTKVVVHVELAKRFLDMATIGDVFEDQRTITLPQSLEKIAEVLRWVLGEDNDVVRLAAIPADGADGSHSASPEVKQK